MRKIGIAEVFWAMAVVGVSANVWADDAWGKPGANDVCVLQRVSVPVGQEWGRGSLLERELFRQAMLIAARDGLGLWTRDSMLRETVPDNLGDVSKNAVLVEVFNKDSQRLHLLVAVSGGSGKSIGQTVAIGLINKKYVDISTLIEPAEKWSRTDFVTWLKEAGFTGQANAKADNVPLPAEEEGWLNDLTILSQYAAVSAAHAAIRTHGESADALGALVRGYANLGQLTRMHWTGAADIFVARSLLYAQRLVVSDPTSPLGLWHRAYALSMAGLHRAALADLAAAGDTQDGPPWAAFLEPMCNYQPKKLQDMAATSGEYGPLANYMAFMTRENCGSAAAVMEAGKIALQSAPLCERVIDQMADWADAGTTNTLTQQSLDVTVQAFRQELPKIGPLPANVQAAMKAAHTNPDLNADISDVSRAFVEATEANEPSWSALGRLLQESNFIHVYRRTFLITQYWGSDGSDFVKASEPLVAGHPYASIIGALNGRYAAVPEEAKHFAFVDATFRFSDRMACFWFLGSIRNDYDDYWRQQYANMNPTAWDLEVSSPKDILTGEQAAYWGNVLKAISPRCAVAPAMMVRSERKSPLAHIPQWSQEYKGEIAWDHAVAQHYFDHQQYGDAIPYLLDYLKTANDMAEYEMLANCYLKNKDEGKWLATLQEGMAKGDYGKDSSQLNVTIANQLMSENKYKEAKPYADAANQSGEGMACVVRCDLGLKEYDAAVNLAQQAAQYGEPAAWYFVCRTTGHGDIAAARDAVQSRIGGGSYENWRVECDFDLAEGKEAEAMAALKPHGGNGPLEGLWLAQLYDGKGDAADRDASLKALQPGDTDLPENVGLMKLGALLQSALAKPDGTLDMTAYEDLVGPMETSSSAPLDYFAAKFLQKHGDAQAAMTLLKRCAKRAVQDSTTGRLARMELHDRGIDPYDLAN